MKQIDIDATQTRWLRVIGLCAITVLGISFINCNSSPNADSGGSASGNDNTVLDDSGGSRIDLSMAGAQQNCGSAHASIGDSADFSTLAHNVSGTVTIIDDCTIHFDNFTYDGGGINVRIYGGVGSNFAAGQNLSINILGTSFNNEAASLRLPQGITLDDFDGLSVWCVPAFANFGDAQF